MEKERIRMKREPMKAPIQKGTIMTLDVLATIIGTTKPTLKKYAEKNGWRMVKVGQRWLVDIDSIFPDEKGG